MRTQAATAERTRVLAAAQGGAKEREALVEAFMPLIASVARAYRHSPRVDRDELLQEGVVGLLRALERYDPALETPFWAYAAWWVRQAMQRLVSEMTRPIVLSDRALRQLARVKDARHVYAQRRGREPAADDLAQETGLPREHVQCLIAAERSPRALEEPAGDGASPGITLGELLADPCAEDAYDGVPRRLALAQLPAVLDGLTDRERTVIRARFGLDGRELTLREIGQDLGLSAERVRQIEGASLDKLRAHEAFASA